MHVPADQPRWRRPAELVGRRAECAVLDQLLDAVRAGASRSLVLHGEPGVGKTALLDYTAARAVDCRVLRGSGVQSEMELPFAGLHQLCGPLLDRLDQLPHPQSTALRTAFGMTAGPPPEPFLVGLAVLSLLADTAQERPLICLVDDQQWLDQATARILAFVARRLAAESVGLVLATRVAGGDLHGMPELEVGGLRSPDAGVLLDSAVSGPVDALVRDQIIAETRGNPLALLELPRDLTPAQLAGGFGLPGAVPLSDSVEESFRKRVDALPEQARSLLLIAASDPSGDPALVWRAAAVLGIGSDAFTPALETGLVELGARVRFRHPLARSAVYRSASMAARRAVHHALAEATDPRDADRRAWHHAQAAAGPDEDVAWELERCAGRAQARGGLAAAAAFLQRSTTLTLDPQRRAGRALDAAQAHLRAGAFDAAFDLLAMADAARLSDVQQAQVDLLRAQLAFVTNRGSDAPPLLLAAARRLASVDADLARDTYLDALSAAIFAGRLAGPGGDVSAVAAAAGTAPRPTGAPRVPDLLLEGTAAQYNAGFAAGIPMLREALARFGIGMSVEEELHWLWLATTTALRLWDDHNWDVMSARHVQLARTLGSLSELPLALTTRSYLLLFSGDVGMAAALVEETLAIQDATGTTLAPYGSLGVAAFRGDEPGTADLYTTTMLDVTRRGEGVGINFAEWAKALLYNGLGHYGEALAAARRGCGYAEDPGALILLLTELVEAAARCAETDTATAAYEQLAAMTGASATDWALGLRSRSRALVTDGDSAQDHYRESIVRLGRTRMRADLARAHLLLGEWLRRQRRYSEAREELRTAQAMFDAMGMAAFAERAARELRAAGGPVRRRVDASRDEHLTAQETQIAMMARNGLSNPEIAAQLFLSPHTVQYHLRKVFTKLGITSRSQLERALSPSHA